MTKILYSVPDQATYTYRNLRGGVPLPQIEILRVLDEGLPLEAAVAYYGTVRYSVKSWR